MKRMKYVVAVVVLAGLFLLGINVQEVNAVPSETGAQKVNAEPQLLQDMDFSQVDTLLNKTLGEELTFSDMVKRLINGELPFTWETLGQLLKQALFEELNQTRKSMVSIIILAVFAAVLANFTKVFEKSQTADIGFYIIYLLLLAILIKSFSAANLIAHTVLGQMTEFMKILMPTYLLTIAASNGATTAMLLYEFLLVLIYAVNWILLRILLPMCSVYVVLNLVNYISQENLLSRTSDLIKQLVGWGLKTLLAVIVGLNAIQGLVAPAVATFKTGVLHKTISAIPGVGNTMNAVSEVVIGSGMLIKNSVGAGMLVVLALLSMIPLLKLFLFMLLYKLTAALIQPIADPRMVECIATAAEGARLLARCVTTAVILFFITIAILTVSTSIR